MGLFEKIFGKDIADQIIPASHREYNELLRACMAEVNVKNMALRADYGFGTIDRWDIDQQVGDLIFSEEGRPQLICKIVMLGSFSSVSQTWMWGWANPSFVEALTKDTEGVKKYGEEKGIEDLVTPKTEATEDETWALGSFACRILGGRGMYRGETDNGFVLMMITEIERA